MALDIVCIGEPLMEFNQSTAGAYLPGFGGDVSNTAIAAARQGAKVGFLTALGRDTFGDQIMELWKREGIDVSHVLRSTAHHTGIYFVTHDAQGHHFTYMRTGSAASRINSSQIPEAYVASAKALHVSAISQAISANACDAVFHAMAVARRHGVKLSYDTNLRLQLWPLDRARAIIHAAISQCDYGMISFEDAAALTGMADANAIIDFYLQLGVRQILLKIGPGGVWVATPHERRHVPGHKVAYVDATGAGDTFAGAFLAEIVAGRDTFAAASYANAAAALSTTGYGAVAPIPRREEVERHLATHYHG